MSICTAHNWGGGKEEVCPMCYPSSVRKASPKHKNAPTRSESFDRNERFRKRNYDLCTAIDLTSLGIVCETLVDRGADRKTVMGLKAIANETLQMLRRINEGLERR